ncbi:MAG: OmpA family protein [Acidiferrobacterales bacterium]
MTPGGKIGTFLAAILFLFALADASAIDRAKEAVFREAKSAFDGAQSVEASFFSPKNYAKAVKYYRSAERKFTSNQDTETVRAELALATEYFQKAVEVSTLAQTKFASALKARADGEKVQAAVYAPTRWKRAEQKLSKSISELERDAVEVATQRATEAEQFYRDAELATIKSTYLREAQLTLAQAEQEKVGKYAPKTLQKAKDLLAQAENALEQKRYDADRPRSLAQQAKYEIKHAMYLAKAVKSAKVDKLTVEDLIRDWETPLRQIAAAADMTASFDSGYDEPAKNIIAYIEDQQDRQQRLEQDNSDLKTQVEQLQAGLASAAEERTALSKRLETQVQRRETLERQVSSLQAEVQQLHLSLGGVSEERGALSDHLETQTRLRESFEQEVSTLKREIEVLEQMLSNVSEQRELLSKRLQAHTQVREQFEQVEGMFSREEARVLRQSGDIVIRLVGLNFASGRSSIRQENYQLLAKVTQAIQLFPERELTIEGHTDSYGSDAANLALSQKRADAVKKYLVANMQLEPSTVEAVGHGETRPVANNETKEGRARNRRIDVVIRPGLSAQ